VSRATPPASPLGRRRFLLGLLLAATARSAIAEGRRWTVAFANLTEEPGATLEGTGFTGKDVRDSFVRAVRTAPLDLVLYDNQRDRVRALANVDDAIGRKVDAYVSYLKDAATLTAVTERLRTARIPMITVNQAVPGVPLYAVDNAAAGRIGGDALGRFAAQHWRGQTMAAVLIGAMTAPPAEGISERAQGVIDGLKSHAPAVQPTSLDTRGNVARVGTLLGKFLTNHANAKVLIATMDDATALTAKAAVESAGRVSDAVIVSHGADPSMHGGINVRREIDPSNRGSIVLGSVGFFLDRYGYDVLPLVLRMLRGEPVPPRTTTRHVLVTATNVFIEYPPMDMS
jgi:ABC-type sugar transport system substrate-binding protein